MSGPFLLLARHDSVPCPCASTRSLAPGPEQPGCQALFSCSLRNNGPGTASARAMYREPGTRAEKGLDGFGISVMD